MSTISEALDSLSQTLGDTRDLLDHHADPGTVQYLLHHARKLLEIAEKVVAAQSAAQSVAVPGATRGALAQLHREIESLQRDAGQSWH